jgi:hypothetical protein
MSAAIQFPNGRVAPPSLESAIHDLPLLAWVRNSDGMIVQASPNCGDFATNNAVELGRLATKARDTGRASAPIYAPDGQLFAVTKRYYPDSRCFVAVALLIQA